MMNGVMKMTIIQSSLSNKLPQQNSFKTDPSTNMQQKFLTDTSLQKEQDKAQLKQLTAVTQARNEQVNGSNIQASQAVSNLQAKTSSEVTGKFHNSDDFSKISPTQKLIASVPFGNPEVIVNTLDKLPQVTSLYTEKLSGKNGESTLLKAINDDPECLSKYNELDENSRNDLLSISNLIVAKPVTLPYLLNILRAGKMVDKDSKEKNLANNLAQFNNTEFAGKFDKNKVFELFIKGIDNQKTISQKTSPTCAATTIQILLSRHYPSEYTRIVTGLCSKDGKVTLRNGDVMQRKDGAADVGLTGRSQLDAAVEDSFMEYANGELIYDAVSQESRKSNENTGGYKGLYNNNIEKLADAVLPYKSKTLLFDQSKNQVQTVEKALNEVGALPVGLNWSKSGQHEVLLVGVDDKNAYIINPQGTLDFGPKFGLEKITQKGILNGPKRERIGEGNIVKIDKSVFFSNDNLEDILLPAKYIG
jgi:hypothetical protein